MQIDIPNATRSERKIVRTWRLRVVIFYGSLCAILAVLSYTSDRTAPSSTNVQTSSLYGALPNR